MKSNLIAMVTVIAFIDGVRAEFQPGDSIPDGLSEHDIEQLKSMRAIEDLAERHAAQLDQQEDREDGMRAFQAARERVQLQQSSITAELSSGDAIAVAAAIAKNAVVTAKSDPAAKTPPRRR